MTKLIAALALALFGCAPSGDIIVANTPAGLSCLRTCQSLQYQCTAVSPGLAGRLRCRDAAYECLGTCDGAHWVEGR